MSCDLFASPLLPSYDPVIHQSNGLIIEVACWAHARRHFEQALPDGVLPKSSTGKAVRYVLNNWKALNVKASAHIGPIW